MLFGIGRRALADDLGLEAAGVALERGFIAVDERYRHGAPACSRSAT